jgi:hypothetical protein
MNSIGQINSNVVSSNLLDADKIGSKAIYKINDETYKISQLGCIDRDIYDDEIVVKKSIYKTDISNEADFLKVITDTSKRKIADLRSMLEFAKSTDKTNKIISVVATAFLVSVIVAAFLFFKPFGVIIAIPIWIAAGIVDLIIEAYSAESLAETHFDDKYGYEPPKGIYSDVHPKVVQGMLQGSIYAMIRAFRRVPDLERRLKFEEEANSSPSKLVAAFFTTNQWHSAFA